MTETARGWRLIPQFLLRRAGFSFALLDEVRYVQAARAAEQAAAAAETREALRGTLLRSLLPDEVRRLAQAGERASLRALSRYRRRIGRRRPVSLPDGRFSAPVIEAASALLEAAEAHRRATAALEAALPGELHRASAALRRLFLRPDLREALFLLSADLVETMGAALDAPLPEHPTAAHRALDRRLFAFLQRLSAKNETTSFFGPLAYGEVDPRVEVTAFGPELPGGVSQRETFTAFWAAAAFGKAAAQLPAVRRALPLRRVPVGRRDGERATTPDGRQVTLSPLQQRLYEGATGRHTASQLAAQLSVSEAEAEAAVVALERALLVRRDLEPLSTSAHPLKLVRAELSGIPEAAPVLAAMDRFEAQLSQFAEADLPGRRRLLVEAERTFSAATGQPARRAAGKTYADRAVLYEDCLGDLQPIRMAPAEAARMERELSPVLELGAAYGALRARSLKALAAGLLERLGGEVPFLRFAEALDQQIAGGALRERDQAPQQLLETLREQVRRVSDGHRARLDPLALRALLPEAPRGRFASPDVMLQVEADGRTRYVIGEVHPYVFAWGSQGYFAPDRERFFAAFTEDLSPWGGRAQLATVLRRRKHKGLLGEAFPGTFIEVTGRASVDPERCVAIADLVVRTTAAGPTLFGPNGPLTLYVGEDDHPHLRAFAPPLVEMPPIRLGAHTPRIEVGEVVLQRERWLLEDGAAEAIKLAPGLTPLAVAVAAARRRLGLPRVVFALAPSEPKPLCLDLEIPFAQQLLQRLVRLGPVTLSEMMPTPDGLWVRRAGGPHTSELRMAFIRAPAA